MQEFVRFLILLLGGYSFGRVAEEYHQSIWVSLAAGAIWIVVWSTWDKWLEDGED